MDQQTLATTFMDHALGSARTLFGTGNARIATPYDDKVGYGDLAVNIPAKGQQPSEVHIIFCMALNQMAISLNTFYEPAMFDTLLRNVTGSEEPHGLRIDSHDRQWRRIIISGLDAGHLREQAEFVMRAVHTGAAHASPTVTQ